ncbi:hypothetical protein Lser_V15G09677 [Lactuca serriola]
MKAYFATEVIGWSVLKIPKPWSDAIEMRESLSKCNNIHVYLYSFLNLARDVSGESSDLISKTVVSLSNGIKESCA